MDFVTILIWVFILLVGSIFCYALADYLDWWERRDE